MQIYENLNTDTNKIRRICFYNDVLEVKISEVVKYYNVDFLSAFIKFKYSKGEIFLCQNGHKESLGLVVKPYENPLITEKIRSKFNEYKFNFLKKETLENYDRNIQNMEDNLSVLNLMMKKIRIMEFIDKDDSKKELQMKIDSLTECLKILRMPK